MPDNRPIGVFDSGVGGLTVLRALHETLPGESTIYLGDLARCPYGPQPQSVIRAYALQIGDLLAAARIKLLVVACNTATAAAHRDLVDRYSFPVVGVIEPGVRAAAATTRNQRIGVIATDGTVASGRYTESLLFLLPQATVVERSASWLVPLVERGSLARATVERDLQPALAEFRAVGVDTLILGCTHFPLVRDIFEDGIGSGVRLIDSAATTAEAVARVLRERNLGSGTRPVHRLLVTGPAEAFAERAQAMFRTSPIIETVDLVPVSF